MPQLNTVLLYKQCTQPTSKIFPLRFKELLPLKLNNSVSYKTSRQDGPDKCVQQMTELFECFKKNDFDQGICAQQITNFSACSEKSQKQQMDLRRINREGTLDPNSDRLTQRQVNVLLKKYPQHNPDVPDRWPR